jgi:hypothetical protein
LAGGLLAMLGWLTLLMVLVALPLALWIKTGEPIAVIAPWVAAAFCWWTERREQRQWLKRHGKPPVNNFPCSKDFQARWGTAERRAKAEETAPETAWRGFWRWAGRWRTPEVEAASASPAEPVPLYIACERIGGDPNVLEAYPATVCDVLMDEMERAKDAGLNREDTIEHLARVIGGAGRNSSSSKPAGSGGVWGGRGRVRGGGWARLGRR